MSNPIKQDPFDSSITEISTETEPSERLEMLNAFAKENYSVKDISLKTELNINQITVYSKALLFSTTYQNKLLPKLIDNIMKLSVSKNRAGRKEYVNIASAMVAGTPAISEQRQPTFSDRLFGNK